jgi:formate hydrogenlyase transcriptional activator
LAVQEGKEQYRMDATAPQLSAIRWLAENGPKELESLFRAIVFNPSTPILIAGDAGQSHAASVGASKVLGLPRELIFGRLLADSTVPRIRPVISETWRTFLEESGQVGSLQLRGKTEVPQADKGRTQNTIPSWVKNHALILLDVEGQIVAWYAGAERIYQYEGDEVAGRHISTFYPREDELRLRIRRNLKRAADEGHFSDEGWQLRRDATRFWANAITMALKDEEGNLQGFATVVRDLSDRHERDERMRRIQARVRPIPAESTIPGVVSGEHNRIPEANDTFLELVGYTREDLLTGRLVWPDLTPKEYFPLDEIAHE